MPLTTLSSFTSSGARLVYTCTLSRVGNWEQVSPFLASRDFLSRSISGDVWACARGTLWGNFTSFDMRKLRASLKLTNRDIHCEAQMEIDRRFQVLTEFNQVVFALEFWTLNELLVRGLSDLPQDVRQVWDDYKPAAAKSAKTWALTQVGGQLLSEEWRQRMNELTPGWEPLGPLRSTLF